MQLTHVSSNSWATQVFFFNSHEFEQNMFENRIEFFHEQMDARNSYMLPSTQIVNIHKASGSLVKKRRALEMANPRAT